MPSVVIDPALPIAIEAVLDSPLRITVDFSFRSAGSTTLSSFLRMSVAEEAPDQVIKTSLNALPKGSALLLTLVFYGRQQTAFRGRIALSQNGASLGAPLRVNGSTGSKSAKVVQLEVDLT